MSTESGKQGEASETAAQAPHGRTDAGAAPPILSAAQQALVTFQALREAIDRTVPNREAMTRLGERGVSALCALRSETCRQIDILRWEEQAQP